MTSPYATPPHNPAVNWYAFLARPRLPSPPAKATEVLRNASILVTGAGGSIGAALSLKLAAISPRKLVLLDASEQSLYRLQTKLESTQTTFHCTKVLGSVSDAALIEETIATHKPTMIFHAAAHKHVALLEEHPLAAISNNVIGTSTLSAAAQRHGVSRRILLSTDKAVEPVSILGATKRIAEQIVLSQGGVVLRLCNVLGTEGSVIDTFLQQISAGEPLPISHPESNRFFVTLEEAVDLQLSAAITQLPSTLLVPQLTQPHRITSLASFLIDTCSTSKHLPLAYVGLRSGDKLSEQLWAKDESAQPSEIEGCFEIRQPAQDSQRLAQELKTLRDASVERDLMSALKIIRRLVPSYMPSQTILARTEQRSHGVSR